MDLHRHHCSCIPYIYKTHDVHQRFQTHHHRTCGQKDTSRVGSDARFNQVYLDVGMGTIEGSQRCGGLTILSVKPPSDVHEVRCGEIYARSEHLDRQGHRFAATQAQRGNAAFAAALPQGMQQCDQHTRS